MVLKGHYPSARFEIEPFYVMYHKLKDHGSVDEYDVSYLNNKIDRWSMRVWEHKKYPALRGSAPIPPRPECEGCVIAMDSVSLRRERVQGDASKYL